MNFPLGVRLALEDYPVIKLNHNCDFRKCLNLLLDVYEQYTDGKISKEDMVWTVSELHRIIRD